MEIQHRTPLAARQPRRVVITGLGAISPLGNNLSETWRGVAEGRSGIGPITTFDTSDFPVGFAGEVKNFDPGALLGEKTARHLDRSAQFGLVVAEEALADAKLGPDYPGSFVAERCGVFVGTSIGGIHALEHNAEVLRVKGHRRVSPFLIPMFLGNLVPGNISIKFGFKGPAMAHTSACATGGNSIGEAFRTIRWGYADVILAGGCEGTITKLTVSGFVNARALSTSTERGPRACRPFDRDRDGFVMAEGGACLVLESLETALARGARILGELAGYGATSDAHHVTAPPDDGEGLVRAMRLALDEAGLAPEEVAYVNAHGTSTPHNDRIETAACRTVFGRHAYEMPVSSTKSMLGHLMGGAGAIEAAICVKAMQDSLVPPTINYDRQDPDCDLDYVPNRARRCELPVTLSNSMGFGGQNASLVFRRYEP